MRGAGNANDRTESWNPIRDSEVFFSSGIPDFDHLLHGGFRRGSMMLLTTDETVGLEDLDLLLVPTYLNFLYQSRGMLAVLPSRDSPHDFRSRLTRYTTRRRFDSRVRVVDYAGEDSDLSYVVNIHGPSSDPKVVERAHAQMAAAEHAVQGNRKRPFIELTSFEVFDTLMGSEAALRMFFHGIKKVRRRGNLGIGILGPGLGCAAGVRRMVDSEVELRREEVGLIIRGVRPGFSAHVISTDLRSGPPHVAFVPRPS